jgi:hypothetical protein
MKNYIHFSAHLEHTSLDIYRSKKNIKEKMKAVYNGIHFPNSYELGHK